MKKFYKHLKLNAIYLTLVLLLINGSVFAYIMLKNQDGKTIQIEGDGVYEQRYNATEYQKTVFTELETIMNNKESTGYDVTGSIVKNFVADFYTWSNKQGSHDVGGLEFVYGPSTLYIQQQAKAYFYRDLTYYQEQYGAENLLEVDSVTIKYVDPEANNIINGVEYPSYYVAAEWTYRANEIFAPDQYQTKGYFSVMLREGRYEIYRYFLE